MTKLLKSAISFVVTFALIFAIYLYGECFLNNDFVEGLEVHFIDVGQGDSILIRNGSCNMLIDGGTDHESDTVISYLERQGVSELDIVVATHPHADHIGGLDNAIRRFDTEMVYMTDASVDTDVFEDFCEAVEDCHVIIPKQGDNFALGELEFKVVGPEDKEYKEPNNSSLCIKMTYGNESFLFVGDAESMVEREMLKSGIDLDADVLKVGHHGSKYSSCDDFVEAVSPDIAVVSVGRYNDYGLPDDEVIYKYSAYGDVYRTDINGNVVVVSDGIKTEAHCDYYK